MKDVLTSIEAGLHEHTDGSNTQLKVVGGDVGSVANDKGQGFHTFDERLGVVLAQVLSQSQAVLVYQGVHQLASGADWGALTGIQIIFSNLRTHRKHRA